MELQPQTPQNAPGRGETVQPSQPPAGIPSAGGPIGGGGSSSGGGMNVTMMLLMFLPMLLVIFLLNRSTSKKQRELESKLKKGDRVVTSSGMIGKISELGTKYVKLELAPGVKVTMLKTALQGLDAGEEPAPASKDSPKDSAKDSSKDSSKDSPKDSGKGKTEGSDKEPFSELKK
jgi:preprotein translocase subunit YajC